MTAAQNEPAVAAQVSAETSAETPKTGQKEAEAAQRRKARLAAAHSFRPDPGWLDRPYWTEWETAYFLGMDPETLRVWRSKSRRSGRLIGPAWADLGTGGRVLVRYAAADVRDYAAARVVALQPRRPRGRPRKTTTGGSVAETP